MALGPYIAGSLRDWTGDYVWSFNAMAILAALGVVPTLLVGTPIRGREAVMGRLSKGFHNFATFSFT